LNVTVEYIVITIIFVAIISSTTYFITNTVNTGIVHISEQQLEVKANTLLEKILLTPGDPPNWGANTSLSPSDIKSFGLAKVGGKLYELDIDKVLRLNTTGRAIPRNLCLGRDDVLRGLGLDPHEYGLMIRIVPAVNASLKIRSNYTYAIELDGNPLLSYRVPKVFDLMLADYSFKPAPNANVTVTYSISYLELRIHPFRIIKVNRVNTTLTVSNWLGKTRVDYGNWLSKVLYPNPHEITTYGLNGIKIIKSVKITVQLNYYTMKNIYVFNIPIARQINEKEVFNASIIGNRVYISKKAATIPQNWSAYAIEVIPPYYVISVNAERISEDDEFYIYELEFRDPRSTSLDLIIYRPAPNENVWINLKSSILIHIDLMPVIVFKTGEPASARRVTVGRIVDIGGYTYYFELTLWSVEEG